MHFFYGLSNYFVASTTPVSEKKQNQYFMLLTISFMIEIFKFKQITFLNDYGLSIFYELLKSFFAYSSLLKRHADNFIEVTCRFMDCLNRHDSRGKQTRKNYLLRLRNGR